MGFLKRLRKRFNKLKRLFKAKPVKVQKCRDCGALKEEIAELNRQVTQMIDQGSQKMDIAERELQLLVAELKQQLLQAPGTRRNLSQQLFELYQQVSPPVDSNGYSDTEELSSSTEFSDESDFQMEEFDEEGARPAEFNEESGHLTEFGVETPTSLTESIGGESYIQLVKEIDQMIGQRGEEENHSSSQEEIDSTTEETVGDESLCVAHTAAPQPVEVQHDDTQVEINQLSHSSSAIDFYENPYRSKSQKQQPADESEKLTQSLKIEEKYVLDEKERLMNDLMPFSDSQTLITEEQCEVWNRGEELLNDEDTLNKEVSPRESSEEIMQRARLAFESVPLENSGNSLLPHHEVRQQLALTATELSSIEPVWSVPAPKPPSLFPNIEHCWLDESINRNDPVEVYMHEQAISWTAPQHGGPTIAMIQAGRMERNPPPDFYVEELN